MASSSQYSQSIGTSLRSRALLAGGPRKRSVGGCPVAAEINPEQGPAGQGLRSEAEQHGEHAQRAKSLDGWEGERVRRLDVGEHTGPKAHAPER